MIGETIDSEYRVLGRIGEGGFGMVYRCEEIAKLFRNDPDLQKIIRHFFQQEKPVAQLCHAPLALATTGVLKGRKTAAYPALAPDVEAAGAEFVDSGAVVDGHMVSARAWPDHPTWMRAFIRLLKQKAPVQEPELAATR